MRKAGHILIGEAFNIYDTNALDLGLGWPFDATVIDHVALPALLIWALKQTSSSLAIKTNTPLPIKYARLTQLAVGVKTHECSSEQRA